MRKRRIIIIDDEENVVRLYRDFFVLLGYEVVPYAEPVVCPIYRGDALSCTKELPCADILITDYRMPRMTGLELLLKQSRRGCKLTSQNKAVVSAYVDEADLARIKDLGCAFFWKPVDLQELKAWVSECEQRTDPSQPLYGQRKEERRPAAVNARYRVYDADLVVPGTALNVSDSGLCLRLPMPLILDQVRVCAASSAPRTASVQWMTKKGSGAYLSGLRYC